ncbi:polysaccharide biosynthesis/export family protein [Arenibaculum pallidiluteum]|uniref:polysaccharide biosynthesis/export family protein n=1 Tax=Arenibaculum pallidiluteum TaxID=2812559 RepID=UPI001A961F04|nr:polysaccharide biosynthesis/export family protein [Arenibaculum pallidiluteum]
MAVTRACLLVPCLLILVLLAAACTTGQALDPKPTGELGGFATWNDEVPAYQVGPGDNLQVRFLLTPEMDEEARISPDGSIGLRVAGQLKVAGLTLEQLDRLVEERSRRWLLSPTVTVSLKEAAAARVYVGGSVARPGAYALTSRLGAMEAILLAGGFDNEARYSQVVLIRRNAESRPMLRTLDLRSFIQSGAGEADMPLAAGDIVYVPRSEIAELNLWIEQFINRVLPFQRSFSYTINRDGYSSARAP